MKIGAGRSRRDGEALRWHLHNGWSWPPQRMCLGGADKAVQRLEALEGGGEWLRHADAELKPHRQGEDDIFVTDVQ
jgi:hypothetical protein